MKQEYVEYAQEKFETYLQGIEDWEKRHENFPEVLKFYHEVLKYYFWKIDHPDDHDSIGACMYISIYSLFKKAVGPSFENPTDFVQRLQSFLSNCILDDSYYKITYERYYETSGEEFRMKCQKRWIRLFFFKLFAKRKLMRLWRKNPHEMFVPCKKEDEGAHPVLVRASDMDPEARTDIEGLWEVLNFYLEKNKKRIKTIKEEMEEE